MRAHQGRVEGKENLPQPAGHTLLNSPQDIHVQNTHTHTHTLSPTCRSLRWTGLVLPPVDPSTARQRVSGSRLLWGAEGIPFCHLDLLLLPPGPLSPVTWKATALYALLSLHGQLLTSGEGHGTKDLGSS